MASPTIGKGPVVVVAGGGYAGLACLITLHGLLRDAELHLLDPGPDHCKLTCLHKTLQSPLSRYTAPFARLGRKYGFRHHRKALAIDGESLKQWQEAGAIPVPGGELRFDALVIATGARPRKLPSGRNVCGQEDFRRRGGKAVLEEFLERTSPGERHVTVVGGGATGIQFLFELREALRRRRAEGQLRLVDMHGRLLAGMPEAFHRHVEKKMAGCGIEYLPETGYRGQSGETVRLEEVPSGRKYALPSQLTLLFPGVAPHPLLMQANAFGQALCGGEALPDVFAAGDCSVFQGRGLNAQTAQAALRKGRQVAENIARMTDGRPLREYAYRELGYFVSLGSCDGVGWLGLKANVLRGLPAYAVKEALELQYEAWLAGLDTYRLWPSL
ncbi:MAG: pyridine nucleotide-disulfide oxidoreductase [Desulfuromonas sp.]|uniref:NAD(P)/FAD-dependent oxidoreductase n=1 Tax=Desulfuromonas sp. TaxID=892 RepID=UPI000CB33C23|nr:FAD-dependent oxidoreductase [Desulfuromonas sp.]PLX86104.1 MAG: pyridine nucleotide-disulfide oxidoreductase [Desulfuromonas sp.]